ncbi:metalloregulator ArsR/SmtB family transcription factor [Cohnella sp. WQ 127256]|uniref:helix-turn-helix transcriptional regulator n=1 Tax=Cohnella sp. WQ 127256 TaxID=2938790 RepID=UPI0021191605|nr:metalloregulator ArsR/SmtB family transcription factor [Cohnella sp. WQ 127256]
MKDDLDLSTRHKIMQMLKTSGEHTAKDLTDKLGITGMAVRRHISILERDGLIDSTTVKLPMGRPAAVYRLTDQADDYFPKKYHSVALDLLAELEGQAGEPMVNQLFDLRQATLLQRYESKMANMNLEHKVAALSEIQNDNGYMATWEKNSEQDYTLTEYNCPIAKVANKYNHACSCELKLFESLLGAEVSRTDCLAKGDKKCVYHIRSQQA